MTRQEVVSTSINSLLSSAQRADCAQTDDPILEIPRSEFQHLLEELLTTYNEIAEMVRDSGILRGHKLAKLTDLNSKALKAEKSPTTKFVLLNAFIRQLLSKIRGTLKSRPVQEGDRLIQVYSKVQARAVQIIEYVKTELLDDPFRRKEISFDSQQARILFSGKDHPEKVSRRDTIRAMKKAEKLCPSMICGHRPNDGRMTMRIIAKTDDLKDEPIMDIKDCFSWQRLGRMIEVRL